MISYRYALTLKDQLDSFKFFYDSVYHSYCPSDQSGVNIPIAAKSSEVGYIPMDHKNS